MSGPPHVAVVGHVEWVHFVGVERLPTAGEIIHAQFGFSDAAGGGGVAAVELARLAGAVTFFTALGDDAVGAEAAARLRAREVTVHAHMRPGALSREAVTFLDDDHERTIVVLGDRLVPFGGDPLPWNELASIDGVYVTGGDAAAIRAARAARVVVATPRAIDALRAAAVEIDVLVGSATDAGEAYAPGDLDPEPRTIVLTHGAAGATWTTADGGSGSCPATPLPGPPVDAYGCGDSFAAGLTYALAGGRLLPDAVAFAATRGAECLARRGPYGAPGASGPLDHAP